MKHSILYLFLLLIAFNSAFSQGQGGGVYIDDNGSCIGSVVHKNQAMEGFGVAGGDGLLLNSTVVDNEPLKQDTTKIVPGDIYCANGEIVDAATYKKRATKDAIGIVYWVSGDPKAIYPKGAVVALDETQGSWGLTGGLTISGNWEMNNNLRAVFHLKDTACYGNTQKLYNEAMKSQNNKIAYKAGFYCYTYQAVRQISENPVKWCLPVYGYLRRLFGALPNVEATLKFLQEEHLGESDFKVDLFSGKQVANCWYWSSDDGLDALLSNYAYTVNFVTGSSGLMNDGETLKTKSDNYIRPMFLY